MVGCGRMKKVTDPLDDRVKARIFGRDPGEPGGYFSSGSEHSVQGEGEESSPSFSDLLFCLTEGDGGDGLPENGSDEEGDVSVCESGQAVEEAVRVILNSESDFFQNVLAVNVSKALDMHARLNSSKAIVRRSVMAFLRGLGYNAAICKAKWESSGGLTAGNYEFIDVLRSDSASTRYIVDLDFAAEFQIARPTRHYERLEQLMPRTFVGKSEQLKQILRAMSEAARRSLKSRGLHIPPWRKHRFMVNKWLGSYKRTTNPLPSGNSPAILSPSKQTLGIKCQSIGFEAAVNGRLFFSAATRTR